MARSGFLVFAVAVLALAVTFQEGKYSSAKSIVSRIEQRKGESFVRFCVWSFLL